MKPFENDSLSFRRVSRGDVGLLFGQAFGDNCVSEYLQWDTHIELQETESLVAEMLGLHESGEKFFWIVSSKADGSIVGLGSIRPDVEDASIGFIVFRDAQRLGYGTSLVSSLAERVYQDYAVVRTEVHGENLACLSLLKRLGWRESENGDSESLVCLTKQREEAVEEKMLVRYLDASEDDFDVLVELRIEAMRESLERVGRFDRERSVERFRSSFVAGDTKRIICDGVLVGFYSLTVEADHLYLSHLYVSPWHQCLGIGALAMEQIIGFSEEAQLPIRLGALRESKSNDFYLKHGFVVTSEDEWDTNYERAHDEL